jgi:regulator of sigma D
VRPQEASRERRLGSQDKLTTLMRTRKETLALLSQLAGLRPYKPDQELQLLLQEFCESLVDYTASAHFQLYRFIEEGTERRAGVRAVADKVYPRIADITQVILDFNEKYDCGDHCNNLGSLDPDLSYLAEILADRISLEDQIIEVLSASRS